MMMMICPVLASNPAMLQRMPVAAAHTSVWASKMVFFGGPVSTGVCKAEKSDVANNST